MRLLYRLIAGRTLVAWETLGAIALVLEVDQLADAVDIQSRSYRLLLWVGEGIERGFLPFGRAHDYTGHAAVAAEWLATNFLNLPVDCRPPERSGPDLDRFARFFASYLRTSFELQRDPPARLVSLCGCYCSWCADLVAASHLKTRKLTAADKRRAQKLKRDYADAVAREQGLTVNRERLERLLADQSTARSLALATYGRDLIFRYQGQGLSGPATLALWREFAWSRSGSPIPKFKLRAKDIVDAEKAVVTALRAPESADA
jgi:hypothetical protein